MSQVKLDGPTIYKKVQKIQNAWNQVSIDFGQKLQIWRKIGIFRVPHYPHSIIKKKIDFSPDLNILGWLKLGARRPFGRVGQNSRKCRIEAVDARLFVSELILT